jgi:hypothetical protein
MVKARYYPPADRTTQWHGEGAVTMPRIDKLVLHTTETAGGWPGYRDGKISPTLTYEPWRHEWRQHLPIDGSARALLDSDGTAVRENRDNVVQVEISCYCDPKYANRRKFVTDLDNRALADLGAFARWLHDEWGLPLALAPLWLPYPASYGNSPARMSGAEYDAFKGILGHQHVSGNLHGDPGALKVHAILKRAGGSTSNPVTPGAATWSLAAFEAGDVNTVRATEAELLRRGFLRSGYWADDGQRGTETMAAIKRFQDFIGEPADLADGRFGPRQWERFWASAV